jgi:hypothetical protein
MNDEGLRLGVSERVGGALHYPDTGAGFEWRDGRGR